jgi:hypothetical protein
MSLYLYRYIPINISMEFHFRHSFTKNSPLTRKLTDVGKHVLQSIGELESVYITKSELNMRVDNELGQSKNLSTEMEGVSETGSLSLFGRERLDGLQVHVVIEMKVVEILSVDQEVKHVVSLSTDL